MTNYLRIFGTAWVMVFWWWMLSARKNAASSNPRSSCVRAALCSDGRRSRQAGPWCPTRLDTVVSAFITSSVTRASSCAPSGKLLTSSPIRRVSSLTSRAAAVISPPYNFRECVTCVRSCATARTESFASALVRRVDSQTLRHSPRSGGLTQPCGAQERVAHPDAPPGHGCTATSPLRVQFQRSPLPEEGGHQATSSAIEPPFLRFGGSAWADHSAAREERRLVFIS